VLVLDEVMAGLHATEIEGAVSLVRRISRDGVSVLVIEHVMKAIMQLCGRIIVLETGTVIAEGDPEQVTNVPAVIRAYLGERWAKRVEDEESKD
jgi:ABC-type branched-subunit amino acid transport system ATPase component